MNPNHRRLFGACAVLVLALATVYWRVASHEFVLYDDPDYVTQNPHVRAGLTGSSLAWAFGNLHGHYTYWHPLTWVSHMLDIELFGLDPAGHHLVNLFLHAVNSVLLLLLLRRWTGEFWPSVIVAGLWALHPLQVDTVAWVTERKNLLSALFWLLTLTAYGRYADRPGPGRYLLVFLGMALGLMTKPVLVTLPCVLLLLDVWPLRRWRGFPGGAAAPGTIRPPSQPLGRLLLEKLPLLGLSAASAAITLLGHQNIDALVATAGPLQRAANALVSYGTGLGKVFLPAGLAVFYPLPAAWPLGKVAACAFVLLAGTGLAVWQVRRAPWLFVGWFWFLGVQVPTIGLIQAGNQAMADRFLYLPLIGLFVALVWGGRQFAAWLGIPPRTAALAAMAATVAAAATSSVQVRHWANTETLFRHALQVTENNYLAHAVLGTVLGQAGQRDEAIALLTRSFEIKPDYFEGRTALANLHLGAQQWPEAITQYEAALRLKPNHVDALNGLGTALLAQGRFTEAIARFDRVVELQPDAVPALGRLAWLLATHREASVRNGARAVELARRAVHLTGRRDALVLNTLAAAEAETGQFDRAAATAQEALAAARAAGQDRIVPVIEQLLRLYQSRNPYRE